MDYCCRRASATRVVAQARQALTLAQSGGVTVTPAGDLLVVHDDQSAKETKKSCSPDVPVVCYFMESQVTGEVCSQDTSRFAGGRGHEA